MLIGLGKMVKKVVSGISLLASKVIGYTPISGGGSSYYTTTVGSSEQGFLAIGINDNKISFSKDGITWEPVNFTGDINSNYGFVYGNNIYAGMTWDGKVIYSKDGVNWKIGLDTGMWGGRINYQNNLFMITHEGNLKTSSDAVNWTVACYGYSHLLPVYGNGVYVTLDDSGYPLHSYNLSSWIYGNSVNLGAFQEFYFIEGTFILRGNYSKEAVSTDAVNWETIDRTIPKSHTFKFNNKLISYDQFNSKAAYSLDGEDWTNAINFPESAWNIDPVIIENIAMVLVGYNGVVAHTTDGISWTYPATNLNINPVSIVAGGSSTILISDSTGALHRSLNAGQSFESLGVPTTTPIGQLAYGNGVFVSIFNGQTAYSSDNGTSWTLGSLIQDSLSDNNIKYLNNLFITIRPNGQTFYSTDGISWLPGSNITGGTDFSDTWNTQTEILYDGTYYVAISNQLRSIYSLDGMSWTLGNSGDGYSGGSFKAINDNGVIIAARSEASSIYSTDHGITWNTASFGDFIRSKTLTYFNNKFYAEVKWSDETLTSTDGINWTKNNFKINLDGRIKKLNNGMYISVWNNIIRKSTDALHWSISYSSDIFWNNMIYNGQILIAYSNNSFITSTDGINWTEPASFGLPSGTIANIIYNNGLFVGVGANGQTVNSINGTSWSIGTGLSSSLYTILFYGNKSTFQEIQISIGNQGNTGSEIPVAVDLYTAPSRKIMTMDRIEVTNTSGAAIACDFGILSPNAQWDNLTSPIVNDLIIQNNATTTLLPSTFGLLSVTPSNGDRITVFPSSIDVLTFKVYGTEETLIINDFIGLKFDMLASGGGTNTIKMHLSDVQPKPTVGSTITISGNEWSYYNTSFTVNSVQPDTEYSSLGGTYSVTLSNHNMDFGGAAALKLGGLWS